MNAIWRTIRGYILWQYERGTLHYDIMVVLIILFVLFSPRVINFNDKPIARNPHPTDVVVSADAEDVSIVSSLYSGVGASAYFAGNLTEVVCGSSCCRLSSRFPARFRLMSEQRPSTTPAEKCRATRCWPSGTDESSKRPPEDGYRDEESVHTPAHRIHLHTSSFWR